MKDPRFVDDREYGEWIFMYHVQLGKVQGGFTEEDEIWNIYEDEDDW